MSESSKSPDSIMGPTRLRPAELARALIESRACTFEDLKQAREIGGPDWLIALCQLGVSEASVLSVLRPHYGPVVSEPELKQAAKNLPSATPRAFCEALVALPLRLTGEEAHVAMADPTGDRAIRELERTLQLPVVPEIAAPSQILNALRVAPMADPALISESIGEKAVVSQRRSFSPGELLPLGEGLAKIRSAANVTRILSISVRLAAERADAAIALAVDGAMLRGRAAFGKGVVAKSVENLRLPITAESTFRQPFETGVPYVGPLRLFVADKVYQAATELRPSRLAVQPVLVQERSVALLCVHEPRDLRALSQVAHMAGRRVAALAAHS